MTRKIYLVGNIRLLKIVCGTLAVSLLLNVILASVCVFGHTAKAAPATKPAPAHKARRK